EVAGRRAAEPQELVAAGDEGVVATIAVDVPERERRAPRAEVEGLLRQPAADEREVMAPQHGDVGEPVAVEVARGERVGGLGEEIAEPTRLLEAAVAAALQDPHRRVGRRDREVEVAVTVDVRRVEYRGRQLEV